MTLTRIAIVAATCVLYALPAAAQIEFVGEWEARYHEDQPERLPGPSLGDYLGLPINDAARMRAEIWDASIHNLPEWQCRPHPADYGTRGPANIRVWKDVDQQTQRVIAYHTHVQWQAQERTIWMDGRPHPPDDAPHTWQGFSTGKWDGDSLVVTTTHLKESYVRRNGVPRSDLATLTERWARHGDFLTLTTMLVDPVYLTEPFIRTTNWQSAPQQSMEPYPCEVGEEIDRPAGDIPHHLPGTNPYLADFAKKNNLPERATRGGAETMSPDFIPVVRGRVTVPVPAPVFRPAPDRPAIAPGIHVQKVQGNVYMLSSSAGNITVQVGDEGAVVVDAGTAEMTNALLDEIRKLSPKPIRYVVNTSFDADHTGGNHALFEDGETIAGGDVVNLVGATSSRNGAIVIGHENVVKRMTFPTLGGNGSLAFGAYPTDLYIGDKKDMFVNGDGIRIFHVPAAHSDGDSMVYFRRADVLSTGDVFNTFTYPRINIAAGGTIQGEIDALNEILRVAIPAAKSEGGTYIVPGHGRLCDMADVAYYRDMVTIIRDRVKDMKQKGMSLDQVKAARPTRDYDGRWGSTAGEWTTDMFVEAVYRTLK